MPTISPLASSGLASTTQPPPLLANATAKPSGPTDVREAFQDFTAGTVFAQMLKSLRKMNGKPAYFHGGQAEETFRNLLDERIAESLADTHGEAIAGPLFDSFANRVAVPPASNDTADTTPIPEATFVAEA